MTSSIGVGAGATANLTVGGNAWFSNSFLTTNVLATSANVTGTANLGALAVTSKMGIGAGATANLTVGGNAWFSNSFLTTNVLATSANITGATNVGALSVTASIGIRAGATANLTVGGNAWFSNSFLTTNVFATSANISGATNVGALSVTSSMGIGAGASANLTVGGNAWFSNSLTTTNVLATSANVARIANVGTLVATSNVGIGAGAFGNALSVQGNAWFSNSFLTTNVFATSANVTGVMNVAVIAVSSSMGILANPTANLTIGGNAWFSNSFLTTNVLSTSANVTGTSNIATLVTSSMGIRAGASANLTVAGNAWFSNSLTTANVLATSANVAGTANIATLAVTSSMGIAVSAAGNALSVAGNAWFSNSFLTTNVFATSANVARTANVQQITGFASLGVGTSAFGNTLSVSGNAWFSNSFRTTNVFATSANTTGTVNVLSLVSQNAEVGSSFPSRLIYLASTGTTPTPTAPAALGGQYPTFNTSNVAFISSGGTSGGTSGRYLAFGSQTIDMSKGFSVACQFAWTNGIGSYERIFDFGNGAPSNNILIQRQSTGTNLMFVYYIGSTEYAVTAVGAIPAQNTLYTVVAIYDPSKPLLSLYVNGTLTTSVPAAVARDTRTLTNTYIGRSNWASDAYSNVNINYLSMYNSVLVSAQVQSVFGQPGYLLVGGNAWFSNSFLTPGVFATSANVTGTANLGALAVTSNMGIGAAATANLTVGGNAWFSNSFLTTNVLTTSANLTGATNVGALSVTASMGINAAATANLTVGGSAWFSNSFLTTNVLATDASVTGTANVRSLVSQNVGIATSAPYDNVGITASSGGLWSTRRLRSAYTGPVVNVRRNSDNAQLDFIADQFGNLSNAQSVVSIDTWLSSTTGNVTTWYDQYRSNNFTQATATSQPQIVKNAGKWVVFFNRDNIAGTPTFYSRMTTPNQISGVKTILYSINTIAAVPNSDTLLGQSGADNAGFRMRGGDFFNSTDGGDRNDFLYTGGRLNLTAGTYFTYWYNNNNFGSSLNIVNDSNPLNQWGLVIGSTPGYTTFGFNSLSDPQSTLTARAFYGYLAEVAIFTDQISQADAGFLYATQYISIPTSPTLAVGGNVWLSNSLTTANVVATSANVAGTANIATLAVTSNMGIGTGVFGNALSVSGNVWFSNSFRTTNVFATSANVATTMNAQTIIGLPSLTVGALSGSNLTVTGNAWFSNSLAATNVFATSANINATMNTQTITGFRSMTVGALSGSNLTVAGNAWISNSFLTTNVFATSANVNGVAVFSQINEYASLGVGTSAFGNALSVSGNAWFSNSFRTTNVFATSAVFTGTANVLALTSQNVGVGISVPDLAWQFEGTTTDYIQGLTGTTTGTASYNSSGKYGQSLIMNGSSYVKYLKTLGYNLGTGGATFATWFKLLAIPTGNSYIFGASGTSYNDRIYIFTRTDAKVEWVFIDNILVGKSLTSPSALVVGTWTHLAFTLFNGTMVMYVNGTQVATRSDAPMSGVVLDTGFAFAALVNGTGPYINAEYDDFRIYNSALSATQVQAIYNQQGAPANVTILGNAWFSNSLTAANVSATSANVSGTANIATLAVTSNMGIGTGAFGNALSVSGNVWFSNSFRTTNVFATSTDLTGTANIATLAVRSNMGVGVGGPGAAQLQGSAALVTNAPTSNTAVSFPGTVYSYMTLGSSTPTNFNTNTSNIFMEAWVYFNSFSAINRFYGRYQQADGGGVATNTISCRTNTSGTFGVTNGTTVVSNATPLIQQTWYHLAFSVLTSGTSYVFVNGFGGVSGAVTYGYDASYSTVIGSGFYGQTNLFIRDLRVVQGGVVPVATFTPGSAPFSYALPSYVTGAGTTVFTLLGQFSAPTGANLTVGGNVWFSNNFRTTNVLATSANVSRTANIGVLSVMSSIGIRAGADANLTVGGNAWFSNSFLTTNVLATSANVRATANVRNLQVTSNIGIGTSATGDSLSVSGNAWFSNSFRTTNVFATSAVFTGTANVLALTSQNVGIGISVPVLGFTFDGTTTDYIQGLVPTTTAGTVAYNASGKYGSAISITDVFTGSYIEYPLTTPISVDNGFTTAFWFQTRAPPSSELYPITFNGSATAYTVYFVYNSSNQLGMVFTDPNFKIPPTTSYVINTWYHIAGTIFNGLVAFYVNGSLIGTAPYTPSGVTVNTRFILGNSYGYAGADILMDDLRIFNTALSATQVQAIYNQQGAPANMTILGNAWFSNSLTATNVVATSSNVAGTANIATLAVTSSMGIRAGATANLTVGGNAWFSNSFLTTNVFATSANISGTANVGTLAVRSNMGIRAGATANLAVGGNAWFSNSFLTTNVLATSANVRATANVRNLQVTSNIGIGTSAFGNALSVLGNAWFSNSLTTANVFATSANVGTANAGTMSSTTTVVPGRSNVTTLNATTLNVLSIYGQVGIGVGVASGGASLTVQGNVNASNALTGVDVSLAGTMYYNEDLTARSIHLLPSAANAAAIQSWISATCNAADQPSQSYWSTSRTPSYGNVVTGPPGGAAYSGSVLLPGDRVLFVPANTSNIGIYSPKDFTFTSISGKGVTPGNFKGGVLMPDGNVLFCPQVSNIGQFNPLSSTFSNTLTLPGGEYNGVLTANGVTFTPTGVPSNVINYNYSAGTFSNVLRVPAPPVTPVLNWSGATSGSAVARRAIAWSPQLGLFVAGGTAVPYLVYSADGKNWVAATTIVGTSWLGATWSPQLGLFVMVGDTLPYLCYSADGKNWTAATGRVGTSWRSVAWSPQLGLFVAAGANSPWLAYSTNGNNWTAAASVAGATNYQGVAWSPQLGLFVACGGTTPYLAYSTNGTTWTAATTAGTGTSWRSVAWSPQLGLFVAAGSALPYLAYSADGKNWTAATTAGTGTSWQGAAWSPQLGVFIAVGTTTPYLVYSTDGKNWVTVTTTAGTNWYNAEWSPQLGLFAVAGITTPWLAYTANVLPLKTGSLLVPSGNVMFSVQGSSNITQFNPVTLVQSNISIGNDGYAGLVLAPNGNVLAVPNSSNVLVINPTAGTSSNIGPVTAYQNTSSFFQGGVLLPSGNVIFVPGRSSNVGMFDPGALTYSNSTPTNTSNVAFSGGTLMPNGQVVFTPAGSRNVCVLYTMTPASSEMCLSPYFNKGP